MNLLKKITTILISFSIVVGGIFIRTKSNYYAST